MSELSPEARALLEQARRSHGPEEQDRDRVLGALHASLGIAVPVAVASVVSAASAAGEAASAAFPAASTAGQSVLESGSQLAQVAEAGAATASKAGWSLGSKLLTWKAAKIALATLAIGGAGTFGAAHVTPKKVEQEQVETRSSRVLVRGAERVRAPGGGAAEPGGGAAAPAAVVPDAPVAAVEPPATEVQQPSVGDHANAGEADEVPSFSHVERAARLHANTRGSHRRSTYRTKVHRELVVTEPVVPAASEPAAPEAAQPPAALQAPGELELIRKAMTSLRDRQPARALALLDEHAARYPVGAFAAERSGLHVIALCDDGQLVAGKSEQAAFLRQHGTAPIAARVRRACVEPKR